MRLSAVSRRFWPALVAVCLLWPAYSLAAAPCGAIEAADADEHTSRIECAALPAKSAEAPLREAIDILTGDAALQMPRIGRTWFVLAYEADTRIRSAEWLKSRAHDPPKTIHFCSLLI